MKGTDLTPKQLKSAEEFILDRSRNRIDGRHVIDPDHPIVMRWSDLVRIVAWYGALRYQAGKFGTGGTFEKPGPIDSVRS